MFLAEKSDQIGGNASIAAGMFLPRWMLRGIEVERRAAEEVVQGGSTQPSGGLPNASVQEGEYTIVKETAAVQSLVSADGIRFMFTSFVSSLARGVLPDATSLTLSAPCAAPWRLSK